MSFCSCKKNRARAVLAFVLVFQLVAPASWAQTSFSPQIAEFLCEQGAQYYSQQKFPEALSEFKKALLANPKSVQAKRYISLIERQFAGTQMGSDAVQALASYVEKDLRRETTTPAVIPSQPVVRVRKDKNQEKLIGDLDRAVQAEKRLSRSFGSPLPSEDIAFGAAAPVSSGTQAYAAQPPREEFLDIRQPDPALQAIEVQTYVGARLVLQGQSFTRFLVTDPALLNVSKRSDQELVVDPRELGETSLYAWDGGQRRQLRFVIGPARWEEAYQIMTEQEMADRELPESFAVGYSIEDSSYYTGRRVNTAERQSHTMAYTATLDGETPYGKFDSAIRGNRSSRGLYKINNVRMGLMDAHYNQFKDIDVRWFDFSPSFGSFGFPSSDLRGVNIDAPMFDHTLNYNAFWGAIPEGDFSFLSSREGLTRTKKAWLEGVGLNYRLGKIANYTTYWVHSYGRERTQPVLTSDQAGLGMDYFLGPVDIGASAATDMENVSYTTRADLSVPKFYIGASMTDNEKNFASLLGGQPSSGSATASVTTVYRPVPEVTVTNSFSGTRDKVFGNPSNPHRPNYNGVSRVNWIADAHTEFELGYTMDDLQGSNSPQVIETKEATFRKKLHFIRSLGTYLTYQNSKSKNYWAPGLDFNNNRIMGGLSFRVLGELYFYYNKEVSILRNKFTQETAMPLSQEMGLSIYRRLFESPFFGRFRIFYRDEEQTESTLSYLSGEDRLETEGELIYQPSADVETFLRLRITNVWAEKTGVAKHVDLDVNWGLRFLWDTGVRWFSSGSFGGYVFYDANSDGIRQSSEKGVKGVLIQGPEGKTATTDSRGRYKISHISGRTAVLKIDASTMPRGYNLTSPGEVESEIVHASTKRVDFGIATRAEISGLVFWDKNGNGTYESGDEPVKDVILTLNGKEKASSGLLGDYRFRRNVVGEQELKIDLKSIPVQYLPKVPLKRKVTVKESESVVVNVPLELQVKQ